MDWIDQAIFFSHLFEDDCYFPVWCNGTDLNQDGIVDFIDWSIFLFNFDRKEESPPRPDPMTWSITPYSTDGQAIASMTATKATDNSNPGGIVYFFQCLDINGVEQLQFSGGWQQEREYNTEGLTLDKVYSFRVKASDQSGPDYGEHFRPDPIDPNDPYDPHYTYVPFDVNDPYDPNVGNTTGWSVIGYIIAGYDTEGDPEDGNAPTPDPMTWASPPEAASESTIEMTASTALDENGVQYRFETSDVNLLLLSISGWQESSSWTSTGLDPNTTYYYRVMAHDKSINQNETAWSEFAGDTTFAEGEEPNEPNEPTVDITPPTPNRSEWEVGFEPYEYQKYVGGMWWAYHYMEARESSDDSTGGNGPVEYKFYCFEDVDFTNLIAYRDWEEGPEGRIWDHVAGAFELYSYTYYVEVKDKVGNITTHSLPFTTPGY